MKKTLIILFLFFQVINIKAIEVTADLFTYDENKVNVAFNELSELESIILANPDASIDEIYELCPYFKTTDESLITPYTYAYINAPGNFPSFWFTFICSAVGTYFIYGVVAGPISVGIVYFSADKDKVETKKAMWGCLAGTILGAGIKYAVLNL